MAAVAMVKNIDSNRRHPTAAPTMKQGTVAASGAKLVGACDEVLHRNTKPAQSLRRTFSKRNSWKMNRSDDKMAAPKASVHPVRNHLRYNFFLYQTNESCSQSVSR